MSEVNKPPWSAAGKEAVEKSLAEWAAEASNNGKGIRCPSCGCADLRVQNTRDGLAIIKRWRVCRNCGRRVVTHEKPIGVSTAVSSVPGPDTPQS